MKFTLCRLDRKFRLVIPLLARNRLGIGDLVRLRVEKDKIIVTRADATPGRSSGSACPDGAPQPDSFSRMRGRPVSKNQKEIVKTRWENGSKTE